MDDEELNVSCKIKDVARFRIDSYNYMIGNLQELISVSIIFLYSIVTSEFNFITFVSDAKYILVVSIDIQRCQPSRIVFSSNQKIFQ